MQITLDGIIEQFYAAGAPSLGSRLEWACSREVRNAIAKLKDSNGTYAVQEDRLLGLPLVIDPSLDALALRAMSQFRIGSGCAFCGGIRGEGRSCPGCGAPGMDAAAQVIGKA